MGKVLINAGGGGGIDPDGLTAASGDVLDGKLFGGSGSDEAQRGALALTGNADDTRVLSGYTYYNTDAKTRRTGIMTVNSILSFSAAAYSTNQIIFTWQNPYAAAGKPFTSVYITYSTTGYDQNPIALYSGFGNNTAPGGISSVILTMPEVGKGYFFQCSAFVSTSLGNIHGPNFNAYAATTPRGQVVINSSQSWTVPAGVRSVDVFVVGGGGGGEQGEDKNNTSMQPYYSGCGGCGGYARTWKGILVIPNSSVYVTVGLGGFGGHTGGTISGGNGGNSAALDGSYIAEGGSGGGNGTRNGGSGGGGNAKWKPDDGGNGGADGGNGITLNGEKGGTGQGTTTRTFGESSNILHSGGGGGGAGNRDGYSSGGDDYNPRPGIGGSGGGGAGAGRLPGQFSMEAANGTANTGGGGGGGWSGYNGGASWGAYGGSGVVIIRWN